MAESDIITALVNLGGTGVLVYVLWRLLEKVLERQGHDNERIIDALLGVVQANTAAMAKVERAIDGLPAFVQQVDARLQQGNNKLADHEQRIYELEQP